MRRLHDLVLDPLGHLIALAVLTWLSLEAIAGLIDLLIGPIADALLGP